LGRRRQLRILRYHAIDVGVICRKLGLTQVQLAKKLDVAGVTLRDREHSRDQIDPDLQALLRVPDKLPDPRAASPRRTAATGAMSARFREVWEHAYYRDYQNCRPDYVNSWLDGWRIGTSPRDTRTE